MRVCTASFSDEVESLFEHGPVPLGILARELVYLHHHFKIRMKVEECESPQKRWQLQSNANLSTQLVGSTQAASTRYFQPPKIIWQPFKYFRWLPCIGHIGVQKYTDYVIDQLSRSHIRFPVPLLHWDRPVRHHRKGNTTGMRESSPFR
jgi:hypothetical protein